MGGQIDPNFLKDIVAGKTTRHLWHPQLRGPRPSPQFRLPQMQHWLSS